MPVWRGAFVAGGLLADVGRYFLAAGIVATLGVAIGFRPDGGAPGVLAAMALVVAFGVSLSWVWTIVALLILDSATVMSLASIVVFPSPSPATSSSQPAPCPAGCRLSSPPTRSATLPARPAPS